MKIKLDNTHTHIHTQTHSLWSFPGDSVVKNPPSNVKRYRRHRFNPWVRKIPWRKWQLTPVFLPGKCRGQRSLVGYSPWGHRIGHNWATECDTASLKVLEHGGCSVSDVQDTLACLREADCTHPNGMFASGHGRGPRVADGLKKENTIGLAKKFVFYKILWKNPNKLLPAQYLLAPQECKVSDVVTQVSISHFPSPPFSCISGLRPMRHSLYLNFSLWPAFYYSLSLSSQTRATALSSWRKAS